MRIKLTDYLWNNRSLLGFAFVQAMAERDKNEPGFVESLVKASVADNNHYDLQIFVNGKELPLKEVFDAWENQTEEMIVRKAEELLNEKLNMLKVEDILDQLKRELKDKLQAEFPNIELKERW